MKKIIPLLLAVMLVVCMAVSASATEVHAVFRFNDQIDLSLWNEGVYPLQFFCDGEEYTGFQITESYGHWYLIYHPADGGWQPTAFSTSNGWEQDGKYQSVLLNGDYQELVLSMISSVGTLYYECDGSACPATDVNIDNVCDDCGLPFAYSLRNDTYEYNGVYLPAVPDVFNGKDTYYTLYDGGTGSYTLVASTVSFQQYGEDVVLNGQADVVFLAAQSGQTEWSQFSSQNATWTNYSIREFTTLVWSSHHVTSVDSGEKVFDGDVNFLPPLWEMMDKVTQGEMVGLSAEVVGTMKVLALCGVGCLALLVVLKLFGKRSLIYRN